MQFTFETAPELIEFSGRSYRRMGGRRRYYLSVRANGDTERPKGLHVAIWEHYSGQIVPKGYEVHHKDTNTFNFEYSNLECITASIHRSMPRVNGRERQRQICAEIRPLAKSWHSSPEGIEWHRQHAFESIRKPGVKQPPAKIIGTMACKWCGDECESRSKKRLFCSPACQIQESGFRRGKYRFRHPHHAAAVQHA